MATRGGYGLTRLLDRIDWPLLARSVAGHALGRPQRLHGAAAGLLAHTGAGSWAGPMALDDFGRSDEAGGVDDVTAGLLRRGHERRAGGGGLSHRGRLRRPGVRGLLWGGNLTMLCALLGTPHCRGRRSPRAGVLFLEDVNEHPYRVERMLLQLLQAGVLARQRAVLLGDFGRVEAVAAGPRLPLKTAVAHLRQRWPHAHAHRAALRPRATKLTLPVGRKVHAGGAGRDVLLGW
jgi:muramoyltetrapeptide carboxypeptidase